MAAKVFEAFIDDLCRKSGYSYDFLIDRYYEVMEEGDGDLDYFIQVTLEKDW